MLKLNIQLFADGGTLVIGTDLDASPLEKKLSKLETKLENEKVDLHISYSRAEDVKFKLQQTYRELDRLKKKQQELATEIPKKIAEYKALIEKIQMGEGLTPVDYLNYDKMGTQIDNLKLEQSIVNKQVDDYNEKVNKLDFALAKAESSYDKQKDKLSQTTQEVVELKNELKESARTDFSKMNAQLQKTGESIKGTITKVAKWGLALFGIRSIYSAIRSAVNLVASENEGIATQIDVIRKTIAEALLPLAQTILNYIAKIMIYINYVYQRLTGKALFDFDKAWKKVKDNAKSTEKSVKTIQKTLAGFDEMNILNDNTTAAGGGGTSKIDNLKNPFEGWENYKIPDWVKKIGGYAQFAADNWREFAGMLSLAGVALGLITGKYGVAIASFIAYLVTQIPELIFDLKILSGSSNTFEFRLKSLIGMINPLAGLIVTAADAYTDLTTETGSTTMATRKLEDAQKALKKAQVDLKNATSSYKTALENAKNAEKELKDAEKETGISAEELFEKVKKGEISYRDMNDQQKRVYEAYLNNIDAQKQLKTSEEELTKAEQNLTDATKKEEKATLNDALAKQRAKGDYDGYKKSVVDAYNEGKISAGEARDYIEQACQDMSDANEKTFTKDLPNDIKSGLDPDKYRNAWTKLKTKWNSFIDGLSSGISLLFSAKTTDNTKKSKNAKGAIINSNNLPRLAPGGIINQPGRGVPLGSAIGGERGAEGVIPLTDSQQMALLGEAIGRYITINANIVNTMNGRVISKELQKVQNESDFAFNR